MGKNNLSAKSVTSSTISQQRAGRMAASPAARRAAQAVAARDDDVPRAAGAGCQRGSGCARLPATQDAGGATAAWA